MMKINPSDFAVLRTEILRIHSRSPASAGEYQRAGHSHKRFRWDLLHATGLRIGDGIGMQGDVNIYAYANDDHIDTALRAILGADYPSTESPK
jgi:hypothetical protein